MSGGSSPSNTTSTTTTELPSWAQPYAQQLLTRGTALSNQGMPVYQGQRTADMNGMQNQSMSMIQQRAQNGDPSISAGATALQGTLGGQYLHHDTGTNRYMGAQPTGANAFMGAQPTGQNAYKGAQPTGSNAYMGDNPYLAGAIDAASQDATRNYNAAVNGTDATFARAGAFGGSAWQQAQQGNAHELATSLANTAGNMRMQNYNQSAGLAENALNRDQQAWQTNAGLAGDDLNRGMNAWQTNAGLAEAGLGRNMSAWQTNAGLADSGLNRDLNAYQTERSNQMNALPLALSYGNQAYTDAAQLGGAGATQFGYDQQKLTDAQNLFNEQAQSPYKSLDVLANTIRGAVGGGGTITQTAPGANPYAQAAGGAAALYSLFGK